jgi:glutathione S-transferase
VPIDPDASIEITAFDWVPPFAAGLVRDLRVRWALEEAELGYRTRLLDARAPRPPEYLREQPFDQVPSYREGALQLFETGAIVQHVGEKDERLLPRDAIGRARAIQWTYAALNSVEPALQSFASLDLFFAGEEWARLRRPGAEELARLKLKRLSDWLGDREWLEGSFTIGDLMMVSVLRILRDTDLVEQHASLAVYQAAAKPARHFSARSQRSWMISRRRAEMSYVDGFVIAVPTANKQKFIDHANTADVVFKEMGAIRIVECWQDDVPDGKVTDFRRSVQAKEDESVCFSWIEWPDKATRDAAFAKMMDPNNTDPRMDPANNPMPFDGKRMIFGGFAPVVDV